MKKTIDGLEGVHMEQETELDHSSFERLEAMRRAKTSAHPLVRVTPFASSSQPGVWREHHTEKRGYTWFK